MWNKESSGISCHRYEKYSASRMQGNQDFDISAAGPLLDEAF